MEIHLQLTDARRPVVRQWIHSTEVRGGGGGGGGGEGRRYENWNTTTIPLRF